jgi:transposase
MYLRTTKRSNRDGSEVSYYQLAHNVRDPRTGNTRAEIIHNFGRTDALDRQSLVRLCESIARVCGLKVEDPLDDEGAAREIADADPLPRGVHLVKTRPMGLVYAVEALWERLDIGPTLRALEREHKLSVPYERALLAMTANRLAVPESKLGVWQHWLAEVFLPSCEALKLDQMYAAMDLLVEHAEAVEKAVFFKTADLLDVQVDLIFYDTTTASFAIDEADDEAEGEGLRQRGHSKEGQWTPQVVVALAVTRQGIPVRSWVFPGNRADVTTVEQVKRDLRGWKLGRALFVGDSGMNSEENRDELVRGCGTYLLATRMGSVAEVKQKVLSRAGRFRVIAPNLHAKEVVVGEGVSRRRYILCYNPKEEKRQAAHRAQVVAELEAELGTHPHRNASAKWAVELLASRRYGRYLRVNARGQLAVDAAAVAAAARSDGRWVLQTNDDTLSVEQAAAGYKSMQIIERCFRTLKRAQICLTPMHHRLAHRIEAHVKICVLALLIERVAELTCEHPWSQIRSALEGLQVSEFQSDAHRFFRRNDLPKEAGALLKKLAIPVPKLVLDVQSIPSET